MASGSGWNKDVVSWIWMWVESMGVASVCGCKEVYRFPHITYPYSSCICSFFAAASLLLFIKKFFFFILYNYIIESVDCIIE